MGCDIHCVIEQRDPEYKEWWTNRGDADIGRNYEMFSVLAGVRNYLDVRPIREPRGLPEDVDFMLKVYYEYWAEDAHSASWVTLKEMREYDLDQEVDDTSIVLSRDETGKITSTCRGTSDETKTEVVGKRKIFELWGREYWYELIKKLEQYDDGTGEGARLVFFFDN
jgi:hypothetical protein